MVSPISSVARSRLAGRSLPPHRAGDLLCYVSLAVLRDVLAVQRDAGSKLNWMDSR
jgi:hypothetical protein